MLALECSITYFIGLTKGVLGLPHQTSTQGESEEKSVQEDKEK